MLCWLFTFTLQLNFISSQTKQLCFLKMLLKLETYLLLAVGLFCLYMYARQNPPYFPEVIPRTPRTKSEHGLCHQRIKTAY